MSEENYRQQVAQKLLRRWEELRADLAELAERLAHLKAQARAVEAGQTDVKLRLDAKRQILGSDETLRFRPSVAVGYWREVRALEARRDVLRKELRELEAFGVGSPVPPAIVQVDTVPHA